MVEITKLRDFASELQSKFDEGMDLRQLSKWSWQQRESGRNVPYMQCLEEVDDTITELRAAPITKQKELSDLLNERAPNSVLPRFILKVTLTGVSLTERFGRGRENVRNLL